MKKTMLFAMFGIFAAATVLESCKKGEGDPSISFRSRKSRMAGDWKMTSGTQTNVSGGNTTTYTYDGTNVTSGSSTSGYTSTMSITKDGTYESVTVSSSTGFSYTVTSKGRWNFVGKVGEFKNKDHAIFYVDSETAVTVIGSSSTTTTDTYTGDQNSWVVEIYTLKNKEMVWKMSSSQTDSGGTDSSNSEWNFGQ